MSSEIDPGYGTSRRAIPKTCLVGCGCPVLLLVVLLAMMFVGFIVDPGGQAATWLRSVDEMLGTEFATPPAVVPDATLPEN